MGMNYTQFLKGLRERLQKEFPGNNFEFENVYPHTHVHGYSRWLSWMGRYYISVDEIGETIDFGKDTSKLVLERYDFCGNLKEAYNSSYNETLIRIRRTILMYIKPPSVQFILGCSS